MTSKHLLLCVLRDLGGRTVAAARRARVAALLAAVVVSAFALRASADRSAAAQAPIPPIVLDNVTLIDGTGAAPVPGARIVIEGDRIRAAGRADTVRAPQGAASVDLGGGWLLPGFIDLHFHIEKDPKLALRQLSNGVTSFRDPGQWIDAFDELKKVIAADGLAGPRMSLCGPHIDGERPAYPADAYVARDPDEARLQAERAIAGGASAIKIYFRLPLASAKAVIDVCRTRRVPSTAHLEILDARDVLRAGLDGLEHITSVATSVVPRIEAERYRQAVLLDNDARREGRYRLLAGAQFEGPDARELFEIVRQKRPFVDATLAVFEVRTEPARKGVSKDTQAMMVAGFANMKRLTGLLHANAARIVVGGHSTPPFAGRGEAHLREMELLAESGLTPMETIVAATKNGAGFLFRERDVGSIEAGKLADLVVLRADPLASISNVRQIERVMMGGKWVDLEKYRKY